ncbi:MAG: phosphomannomutase/phosphoglucomutase, partial [Pseudomonadota bacterium]
YDIRGIYGETLHEKDAFVLGQIMGYLSSSHPKKFAIVGRDGRYSSPSLETELCRGLVSSGINVMRIGLVPSPQLYFINAITQSSLAIMVTGSHNPGNYNGFKIVKNGKPFFGEDLRKMANVARTYIPPHKLCKIFIAKTSQCYVQRLMDEIKTIRPFRVAWDPGNGAACPIVSELAKALRGEHFVINEKVDGQFPAHHPDPTVPKNLVQLQELVMRERCDVGFAFDGDGDRIGVISNTGEIIWGDKLLALLARDVLRDLPGSTIIGDVKSSQTLFDEISRLGGTPHRAPTGHSIIKSEMERLHAPLAGEMSGHIFFAHKYYGFDDALYSAMRVLALMEKEGQPIQALADQLPKTYATPEIRLPIRDGSQDQLLHDMEGQLGDYTLDHTDGVRAMHPDKSWILLRASHTESLIVVRIEAPSQGRLQEICSSLYAMLQTPNYASYNLDLTDLSEAT